MGTGHYDAVVPIPQQNKTLKKQNVELRYSSPLTLHTLACGYGITR